MKKLIVMMMLALSLSIIASCNNSSKEDKETLSKEAQVKKSVEKHLKSILKDPSSLEITSCEVRKEAVPIMLDNDLLSQLEDMGEVLEDVRYYSNMSNPYLFADEIREAVSQHEEKEKLLKSQYNYIISREPETEYIAYTRYTAKNPMGGRTSGEMITIVDNKDPSKVLGYFEIDSDFSRKYVIYKKYCEGKELEQNRYGKFVTDSLPYFDQFILSEDE